MRYIKNFDTLATTMQRRHVLEIAEAGLAAIDTAEVIKSSVRLEGMLLTVRDSQFDLNKYKSIRVIGFGKASCKAATALEQVLGSVIQSGIVIGLSPGICEHIETYAGTHPKPSEQNFKISEKIKDLAENASEDDLVIVIVSGGGSSLLCWPQTECTQGPSLYEQFLKTGGTISELNTIRKHISGLKGGGLAKILYPATVVSLILSDVPGSDYAMVSSGPTFKDTTTIEDARRIIATHQLGNFDLIETPKEDKYFEKITNVVLVSNTTALQAMAKTAESLGYRSTIVSDKMYEPAELALENLAQACPTPGVALGGGEVAIKVARSNGHTGGRNIYLSHQAIHRTSDFDVFASVASDGLDNGPAAGAIIDAGTQKRIAALEQQTGIPIASTDSYKLFEATGDLLMTGPTEANVSDLMIYLKF